MRIACQGKSVKVSDCAGKQSYGDFIPPRQSRQSDYASVQRISGTAMQCGVSEGIERTRHIPQARVLFAAVTKWGYTTSA